MDSTPHERVTGELLAPDISDMLDKHFTHEVRAALAELMDPEVADVLIELPPQHRVLAFRLLPRDRAADVFTFLPPEQQDQLVEELSNEQLAQIFNEMDPDDRAELFDELPGQLAAQLLGLMRPEERDQTQVILGYPAESVGRIMTPDYLTLRPEWTVEKALAHIRREGHRAEIIHTLYVVDERGRLLDDLRLRDLILAEPHQAVRELMDEQVPSLGAREDREEAVRVMERYDRSVLPVVDQDNILVGIVTFDDVADVAAEEVTEDIHKMGAVAALDDPYMSVSLGTLFRKRGVWLCVLFLGQMLTATAMEHYEDEIAQAIVLAIFIPLIISSGGNSGSQAASLIIRAMAIREITLRDWFRVMRRELACGVFLGVLLGAVGLFRVQLWQWFGWADYTDHYVLVALTVGVALVWVVSWGTLVGSMLPFLLRSLGLDPATSSAPFVATFVDVTGLIIYFTTAVMFLRGTLL